MSWSLKLFTIRGIPVRMHGSFLLILLWAAWLGFNTCAAGWPLGVLFWVVFTLLLFVCVVLHELGHSLVAQIFGVTVQDITLWPIGGVARIAKLPQRPYQEFLITAAGPAVNFFLAIIFGVIAFAWIGPGRLIAMVTSPYQLERLLTGVSAEAMLIMLALNNLLLALFNLIPAFPMDGGRLVRSVLAAFMPFGRATKLASWLGQGAAVLMGGAALLTSSLFLGLVAAFVFVAAWGERQQAVTTDHLRGVRVRQAMQPIGGGCIRWKCSAPRPAGWLRCPRRPTWWWMPASWSGSCPAMIFWRRCARPARRPASASTTPRHSSGLPRTIR